MKEREALKLALEALKAFHYAMIDAGVLDKQEVLNQGFTAATAIKEALAQPEQEPVAWLSKGGKGIWFHKPDESLGAIPLYAEPQRCPNCDSLERQNAELDLRLAEQDQPPFGFLTNKRQRFNFEPNATGLSNMPMTIDWKIPLYGSPQPQRKPLLASDIVTMYDESPRSDNEMIEFARAIEAAHGIKGDA